MRALKTSFPALFLCCVFARTCAPAYAGDYVLGQGVNAGAFNIAGYATVEAKANRTEPAALVVDDLSIFAKGSINKALNPFLEAELAEADLWVEGRPPLTRVNPRFDIERLYNDFILDDGLTLRAGKMLAPVGEWNSIHAGPLVRTTSRPLTTSRNYPEFVTGVSLIADGLMDHRLRIEAYWQPAGDLDAPSPSTVTYLFEDTAGLHAEWALGLTDKIAVSVQSARVKGQSERQVLVGLNHRITLQRLEIESELTWTSLRSPLPGTLRQSEYAGYLQGTYRVSEQWFLVGRGEAFRDRRVAGTSRNLVAGVNYRPSLPVVWKIEYVHSSGPDLGLRGGVNASFNILF